MSMPHDRNGCALQGAAALLDAIDGVVPVLHANAGCSVAFGHDGASLSNEIASTTLLEKQVVFGGTARLREQIKNALQVREGELFVVLSGCVPEVIGDDVPAMVKEAREQRFPVFDLAVPGFRGHAWHGHAAAARALLAQGPAAVDSGPAPAEAADVNLFGLVPGLDPGWQDDLFEIEALLAELGLSSHRLIGFDQGLAAWQAAPRARLSLVLSPWGADAAAWLQQQHGVPVLDAGWLPVGSRDAGRLLALVGQALGVDAARVATVRSRLDARLRHALCSANTRGLLAGVQRRVVVVGGSAAAVGQARFLAGTLGLAVEWVVITDQPPEECHAALTVAVHEATGSATPLSFLTSRVAIAALLRHVVPDLVIGSALEEAVALGLGAAHVEAATPLRRRPALARTQVGVRGALTLLEDLIAALRAVVPDEPGLAPAPAQAPGAIAQAALH